MGKITKTMQVKHRETLVRHLAELTLTLNLADKIVFPCSPRGLKATSNPRPR